MMTQEALTRPWLGNYFFGTIRLCKAQISLFAALSAVAGLCVVAPPSAATLASVAIGVWLVGCGAGALNQYQERDIDALMPRTAGRPLPSGCVRPRFALAVSFILIGSGTAVLCLAGRLAPAGLGLAAVFWYNGFYTGFKTRSALAAIPGAAVGAIPPAVGWTAGGGHLLDFRLAALCFFFFMWQVLHFFIHCLAFAKEYEKAELPSLSGLFTESQLKRLAFQWLLAVAASAFLVGFSGLIHSWLAFTVIAAASFWFIFQGIAFITNRRNVYARLFRETNYYLLIIVTVLSLDGYFYLS
ncbi:MAG: protoheme IX farnesyltransferase [Deltaproteobacteria bacterium]|nr:protoheme IX farnesyltransferase [Deltaproteobacteria bacterium]